MSITFVDLMPMEELASLTSAVITLDYRVFCENQDGNQGFGKPSHKKWLPTPLHHLKILKLNRDSQATD